MFLLEDVRAWVEEEQNHTDKKELTGEQKHTDKQRQTRTDTEKRNKSQVSVAVGANPCRSLSESTLVANAVLSLFELVLLLA